MNCVTFYDRLHACTSFWFVLCFSLGYCSTSSELPEPVLWPHTRFCELMWEHQHERSGRWRISGFESVLEENMNMITSIVLTIHSVGHILPYIAIPASPEICYFLIVSRNVLQSSAKAPSSRSMSGENVVQVTHRRGRCYSLWPSSATHFVLADWAPPMTFGSTIARRPSTSSRQSLRKLTPFHRTRDDVMTSRGSVCESKSIIRRTAVRTWSVWHNTSNDVYSHNLLLAKQHSGVVRSILFVFWDPYMKISTFFCDVHPGSWMQRQKVESIMSTILTIHTKFK